MPRFVVLEHDHPVWHWDWMLEDGDALRTWRLEAPPEGSGTLAATPLPRHRLAYLEYEGPVSGGRGSVARWDRGTFAWVQTEEQRVVVDVAGLRVRGRVELRQTGEEMWVFSLQVAEGPGSTVLPGPA